MRLSLISIGLLIFAFAAILLATLFPGPMSVVPRLGCLFCGDTITADAVLNVVLFAPLGAFAAVVGWRWGRVLLAGALLSAMIELAQVAIPGRDASIADVLLNTLGVAVGVGIVRSSRWWLRPTSRRASAFSLTAALVAVGAFGFTAYLFSPVFPPDRYAAQWTGDFPGLEVYRGRVLEATLGGIQIPSGALDDSDTVRVLLRAGAPLHVRMVAGPSARGLAPILTITDPTGWRIAFLGVDNDDLVFLYRQRASLFRLDDPDLRVMGGMRRLELGDTVSLMVARDSGSYCIGVDEVTWCGLGPPTLGTGWAIFHADGFPHWFKTCLNVVWIAALVLPFGFWARPRWSGAVGFLAIAASMLLLPTHSELGPSRAAEWLGALIGLALGQMLQIIARRVGGPAT